MLSHAHHLLLGRAVFVASIASSEPLNVIVVMHGGSMLVFEAPCDSANDASDATPRCEETSASVHDLDSEECTDVDDSLLEGDTSVLMPIGGEAHLLQFESKLIIDVAFAANTLAVLAEPFDAPIADVGPAPIAVEIGVYAMNSMGPGGLSTRVHTFPPQWLDFESARTCVLSNACVLVYDAAGNIHVQYELHHVWHRFRLPLEENDALVSLSEIAGDGDVRMLVATRAGLLGVLHLEDVMTATTLVPAWQLLARAQLPAGHAVCAASATATHGGKCVLATMHEFTTRCSISVLDVRALSADAAAAHEHVPTTTPDVVAPAYSWQLLNEDSMCVQDEVRIWLAAQSQTQLKLFVACAHGTHWLEHTLVND